MKQYPALIAFILALGPTTSVLAQSPGPVTLDPTSTIQYRVTLVGRAGSFVGGPPTASLELGAPAPGGTGPITLRSLHIAAPQMVCPVSVQGSGSTDVTVTGLVIDAAPAPGAVFAGQGVSGQTLFSGSGIAGAAQGMVNYTAINLSCNAILAGGGACSGPFNLATPGPNASGAVILGMISPGAPSATFSFTYSASFPLATGAQWGSLDVITALHGTIGSAPPVCAGDFNADGHVSVQDIFSFLGAWFAHDLSADINHDGAVSVQDIFSFLAAWFAGC